MNSNAQKLRDAAAITIGKDEADILLMKTQDDAVRAFKRSGPAEALFQAAFFAAATMQNMRQGTFRGATERVRKALQGWDTLP